jgi:hypothetical protein
MEERERERELEGLKRTSGKIELHGSKAVLVAIDKVG